MGYLAGAIIIFAAAYMEAEGVVLAPVMFLVIGMLVMIFAPNAPLINIEVKNSIEDK